MNVLSKYCPTFTRGTLWLWNSPTFTTWGNYAVQSLRLILVTPLLLTQFNETEIAAWYLFASLNFFGVTLSQRLGLTFTRMFAFAMGGASNLAPIKGKQATENGGQPNWPTFERAYGTIGSLNFGIGWLNVLIALAMGWFGLGNLLEGYDAKGTVWLAFGLMLTTSLIVFNFQRYSIALQGMNYIALVNRWETVFSLLSLLAGIIVLSMGGGLVALVVAMQSFVLANILRNYLLLRYVQEGRIIKFRQYSFDREVFSWAWAPTWKGFVGQFGSLASTSLCFILATERLDAGALASLLFSYRMVTTVAQFSLAFIQSRLPYFCRLAARSELKLMHSLFVSKIRTTIAVYLIGIVLCSVMLPLLLGLIDAKIGLISIGLFYAIAGAKLIERFFVSIIGISGFFNLIVGHWRIFFGGCIGVVSYYLAEPYFGLWAFPLCIDLPVAIALSKYSLKIANERIGFSLRNLYNDAYEKK